MQELERQFDLANTDPKAKVVVLTGAGPYYCAGVNLSATIKPMHPRPASSSSKIR